MKQTILKPTLATIVFSTGFIMLSNNGAMATNHTKKTMDGMNDMMSHGLVMPAMDASKGRKLFASKGCVVCHSINGVGGEDAPLLDAEYMDSPMNPFDFAAKMWRGAEAMVMMQREELGDVIELTGDDLANIIAFVHDPVQQATFSEEEIPKEIAEIMNKGE
jgi:cytochrome c